MNRITLLASLSSLAQTLVPRSAASSSVPTNGQHWAGRERDSAMNSKRSTIERRRGMRLFLRTLPVVAALAVVGTAAADGPVITDTQDRIVNRNGFLSFCGFPVAIDVQRDVRFIRFFDDSGRLVREIRHIHFEGTLTANGKTLWYEGRWKRTFDAADGTLTFTGQSFKATIPGSGVSLTTGREVVNARTFERLEQSGHPPEEFIGEMCEYFATA